MTRVNYTFGYFIVAGSGEWAVSSQQQAIANKQSQKNFELIFANCILSI
jgi:hypothetical protein